MEYLIAKDQLTLLRSHKHDPNECWCCSVSAGWGGSCLLTRWNLKTEMSELCSQLVVQPSVGHKIRFKFHQVNCIKILYIGAWYINPLNMSLSSPVISQFQSFCQNLPLQCAHGPSAQASHTCLLLVQTFPKLFWCSCFTMLSFNILNQNHSLCW